jgi:hypothetical protein
MPEPTTRATKAAHLMSGLIAGVAVAACVCGLWVPGLYRDNRLVTAVWFGNDVVTLVLAVPVLVGSLVWARRGSGRGQLVWLGALDYMLYNSAFYLFAAAFNAAFLLYAALFALSIYALVFGFIGTDLARATQRLRASRWVAAYMLLTVVTLGGLWTAMSLGFVFTGKVPAPVVSSGHPTAIVFALDLTLLLPPMALAAIWLWHRRPWGVALAIVLNVKGALYTAALAAGTFSAMQAGEPGAAAQLPVWLTLSVLSLAATLWLLWPPRGLRTGPAAGVTSAR